MKKIKEFLNKTRSVKIDLFFLEIKAETNISWLIDYILKIILVILVALLLVELIYK